MGDAASVSGTTFLSNTVGISDTIIASHPIGIEQAAGTHALTGAASFVDAAHDDYQLTANSAAINTGVDSGITNNFFGELRPQQGGFDIGYDESPYSAVTKNISICQC